MKTVDFFTSVSSKQLKESFEKQFGSKLDLDKYSREQLEDMRNKLRTRVFQQEGTAGFNDLLTNETYQKDQALLKLLNTRIKEMLGEDIKKLKDKMVELSEAKKGVKAPKYKIHSKGTAAKDYDGDGKVETPKAEVWGSRAKAAAKAGKPFEESAKPDFLDMDKDGDKKEPMKKAAKEKKANEGWDDMMKAVKDRSGPQPSGGAGVKKGRAYGGAAQKDVKEPEEKKAKKTKESVVAEKDEGKPGKGFEKIVKKATPKYGKETAKKIAGAQREKMKKAGKLEEANTTFKQHVRIVNENLARYIAEDEEGKAKAITAASDMVNDFTSWMQRVGQYQTKAIIELADAIRADFGAQEAEQFKQSVSPALAATLETLTQQREIISNAVAVLAGEQAPAEPMGMEPGTDADMAPTEPGMEPAEPDMMNEPEASDEFGAAEGPSTSREVRESVEQRRARKLAEAHSIIAKLAK